MVSDNDGEGAAREIERLGPGAAASPVVESPTPPPSLGVAKKTPRRRKK